MEETILTPIHDQIIETDDYKLIDIDTIHELPTEYPEEFIKFCKENDIKIPKINCATGIAWSVMLKYRHCYFNRVTGTKLVKKFNIKTSDIIQQFNKANQYGIKTSSDMHDKGKNYIVYPYALSNKPKMRKNFKFDGTEEEKNTEIDKIKSNIKANYNDVPNNLWQSGHKNPDSTDNSNNNFVLQPPIQGKYRDDYIFIDTLTKMPVPKKLKTMIEKNEIEITKEQTRSYIEVLTKKSTPEEIRCYIEMLTKKLPTSI